MPQISRRIRKDAPAALLSAHFTELKRRYHVKRIGLFGSVVRGEMRPESDIDVLVEFREGQATLHNLLELRKRLQNLFRRRVDLVTVGGLSPLMRPFVEGEVAWCEEG
jgi:predicted nucleotidyltransferase